MSSSSGDESGKLSREIIQIVINKYDNIMGSSEEIRLYHETDDFMNQANLIFRKLCHFGEYCILGILLMYFLISIRCFRLLYCSIYSLIFAYFYALLDEYLQTFINGRSGQILDTIIDMFGIIFGLFLVIITYKNREKVLIDKRKNNNS